jgi:hypothetical protein
MAMRRELRPCREKRTLLVVLHDATPAFARETRVLLRDLAPLLGRRLSLGVVPNWNRRWHLAGHPDYCRLVRDGAEELLLHGYFHRRQRGWSPTSWLVEGSDEMNGLDTQETRQFVERGQSVFAEVFGERARGFLAPAWQLGHIRASAENDLGLDYVLGFFSLASRTGRGVGLTTWTWDCGRWAWLGHVGHGIGRLSQSLDRGVPTLAIHPRDLERGFWPRILRLIQQLLEAGYEPTTPARLLAVIPSEAPALRSASDEGRKRSRPDSDNSLYRDGRDSSLRSE